MSKADGAQPGPDTARGRRTEDGQPVAPQPRLDSYYGRPVLKELVWRAPEIPGYLFLGGLAGASSVLAAGAQATGNRELARAAKTGAVAAIGLGGVALTADLGRPMRFLNMLRVFKVSSPMSVGSWLLAVYGPTAAVAAACAVTGRVPRLGAAASALAAGLGAGVATYSSALLADTAVPAWHDGRRELPYLFAGSAATAAGGLGMLVTRTPAATEAARFAVAGAAAELAAKSLLMQRLGAGAAPYQLGRAGQLIRTSGLLTAAGMAGAALAGRNRPLMALSGITLLAASVLTRFGIFAAGQASARDPAYTVGPQRERLAAAGQPVADGAAAASPAH
jgi:formate-dependent nitrite reductase membrane component NrfD